MIKKILFSIVVLLLLVGGGFYFYLDSIVKSGIEVVGTRVLGTTVTVDSILLSPFSGQGTISGLRVENPEGFESQYAFELDSVSVELDVNSLFSDVIEIQSVIIMQPIITYETKITTDNIRTLLANIPESGTAAGSTEESGGAAQQVIIREFKMLGSQLNFVAAAVTAPLTLADIEIQNIGAQGGSTSAANAIRVVLRELTRTILNSELPSLDLLRDSVEGRIRDGAQQVEDAVEDLGGRLRNILN
ncbi:MAG: hypothetical protein WDZ52_01845 [Pseudohongiellaceae bacterium]